MNKNAETTPPELETVELNLPVKAEYGVYDTSSDYGKKWLIMEVKLKKVVTLLLQTVLIFVFPLKS